MTGLPYPNEEVRARRNLIVKISNHPPIVRPQHGVNAADLVFEYEAEGNVTRFGRGLPHQCPGTRRLLTQRTPARYRIAHHVFGALWHILAPVNRFAKSI